MGADREAIRTTIPMAQAVVRALPDSAAAAWAENYLLAVEPLLADLDAAEKIAADWKQITAVAAQGFGETKKALDAAERRVAELEVGLPEARMWVTDELMVEAIDAMLGQAKEGE